MRGKFTNQVVAVSLSVAQIMVRLLFLLAKLQQFRLPGW
jgi:hypothetical protein